MLKEFLRRSSYDDHRKQVDDYLSDASDLADIERRIRQMDRGQAPWQLRNTNFNLRGWV